MQKTELMSNNQMVSVIVPVYNTAPWLARCLDSICAQTYRNLEILCVNDGSTDNSAEILAEYAAKDSRIKVYTQANAGLSAARNTALEHATGEWVTGVDSDDYLEPRIYEQAMQRVTAGVDLVFFGVLDVDEEGREIPPNPYFTLPAAGEYEMTPELAGQLNACFWSKLWRCSLIAENKLRFPHGLVHEDEAFYFLAAPQVKRVAVCSAVGYYYVQRAGSIMNDAGMAILKQAQRYALMLEYTAEEYKKRAMLQTSARCYLISMFVHLCLLPCWSASGCQEHIRLLRRYRLYKDDYRLEQLVPVRPWQRLFLSRYPQSKVYRFFGVAVWSVCYSEQGRIISSRCILLDRFVKRLG